MKFFTLYGKYRPLKHSFKYKIDWNKNSRSKFQTNVKNILYDFWRFDLVYEEFPVLGTRLTLDFYNYNKNIAVEVQGAQHLKYVEHFHQNRTNFLRQIKRDNKKLEFCELNSIKLIEIYPEDELSSASFAKLFV
jgi:hypothetical protein